MPEQYEKQGYLLEDFRLFHLQDTRGVKTRYHYHEFCKLLLLISGSGSYTVEGKRFTLRPGDAVLLGSHCVHRCEFPQDHPYERIILYISPSFLQRHSTADCAAEEIFSGAYGHVLRLQEPRFQKLLQLTGLLEQELSAGRYGAAIASSGLLLQLLAELGRCQRQRSSRQPEPLQPRSELIRQLVQHLEENWDQPLSIDALAAQFYTSRYHLMHQFRQETGTTILRYVTEQRLFRARDLMAQGMSTTQACFQVGFGSYSSFSRAYTRLFGTTPAGRPGRTADDLLE